AVVGAGVEATRSLGVNALRGVVDGPAGLGQARARQPPLADRLVDFLPRARNRRLQMRTGLLTPGLGFADRAGVAVEEWQRETEVELIALDAVVPGVSGAQVHVRVLSGDLQAQRLLGHAVSDHYTVHVGAREQRVVAPVREQRRIDLGRIVELLPAESQALESGHRHTDRNRQRAARETRAPPGIVQLLLVQ